METLILSILFIVHIITAHIAMSHQNKKIKQLKEDERMSNQEIYDVLEEITEELKRVTLHLDDEDMSEIASVVDTIETVALNYEEDE